MPQVRFSSSTTDLAASNTNGDHANGTTASSPFDFIKSSPNTARIIAYYTDRLAAHGFTQLNESSVWPDVVQPGGKYYLVKDGPTLMAFTVGKRYSPKFPSALIAMPTQTVKLLLRPHKEIVPPGYELLGITPISSTKGGKSWLMRKEEKANVKVTYTTNDGITLDTVVSIGQKAYIQSLSAACPQLDAIATELEVPSTNIQNIQQDLFNQVHHASQNTTQVARVDDKLFSCLAFESMISASLDKSDAINTVICFGKKHLSGESHMSQLSLATTTLERVIDALNPRKDLQCLLTPQRSHKALHFILSIVHLIYFIITSIRSILSRIYHLLSGFILTSNSKELIRSDISTLGKIPSHLAVIVSGPDLERLVNQVADLAAWSICSLIPTLTVYEAKGELKGIDTSLQVAIKRKLRRYFRETKKIVIRTPGWDTTTSNVSDDDHTIADLEINILSREDGREAILDLTRSLCKLSNQPKTQSPPNPLRNGIIKNWTNGYTTPPEHPPTPVGFQSSPLRNVIRTPSTTSLISEVATPARQNSIANDLLSSDITIPFLDAHLCSTTIGEPNLLLVFTKSRKLDGFPPWSVRLCEICWVGVSGRVTYRGFLRGLKKFGRAEMRWGR